MSPRGKVWMKIRREPRIDPWGIWVVTAQEWEEKALQVIFCI